MVVLCQSLLLVYVYGFAYVFSRAGLVIIMTLNESVRANDKELKAYILVYQDRHERIGEGLTMDRTIRRSFLWPSIGYLSLSVPLKRDKH